MSYADVYYTAGRLILGQGRGALKKLRLDSTCAQRGCAGKSEQEEVKLQRIFTTPALDNTLNTR
jgi:hypothetical protein